MLVTIGCIFGLSFILVCILVNGAETMTEENPDYTGDDLYDLDKTDNER